MTRLDTDSAVTGIGWPVLKSRLAGLLRPIACRVIAFPRNVKLWIAILLDVAVTYGAALFGIAVYRLLCSCTLAPEEIAGVPIALAFICVAIFFATGLYRPMLRYRNPGIIFPVLLSTAVAALLVGVGLNMLVDQPTIGPMIGLLWLGSVGLMLGWRLVGGTVLNLANRQSVYRPTSVAIYGAGRAGAALAEAMQRDDGMSVRCFLDDDKQLRGRTLNRLKVYSPKSVGRLVGRSELDMVVLAMPSASPARRAAIINDLAQFQVKVETAPSLEEILSGRRELTDLRGVTAEELLSREPVEPDRALVAGELAGKCVMITGGGGSIGSALCRAVLDHAPAKLVIFEQSEFALYKIEMELRKIIEEQGLATQLEAILGTVLDASEVERTITAHNVEIIYHAAAYKHVPLVEINPIAGANNNIIGTYNVAEAARRLKVGKFVLISTDKAVRPTNVMGASKRMSEKLVQAFGQATGDTDFALVRFGNVLDSAGSVIPLFREQIANGGPVTVTDPRVERYFMTIPEAAELVIQAGAMAGGGGDVFHLDMGDPVNVADLARKLIHLSGRSIREPGEAEGDIEIQFIGLRPGEKLYEELLVDGESRTTAHPRIFRAAASTKDLAELREQIARLRTAIETHQVDGLIDVLCQVVESYAEQRANAPQAAPKPDVAAVAS